MLSIIRIVIKLACLRIERKDDMENQFIRADEVARELEVSRSYAYRLIQQLNAELRAKGYITIAGRVNRQYFRERLYEMPAAKEVTKNACLQG
jgi:predicted transcriptional regulator